MKEVNYIQEINKLRKEKNAIILAHYYQTGDIQDIADFVGDSLALAQKAEKNKASIIIVAGVKFMAETVKIITPEKKVIIPDLEAGCSLADSCKPEDFEKFIKKYPGSKIISYINTTAEIKAMSDIICTSSNAVKIIESFPENDKIIFAPDRNMGDYIEKKTGRNLIIWDGACHVHEKFSLEEVLSLKQKYPDAKVIVHPECERTIRNIADFIGSTSALIEFTLYDKGKSYIVATEPGVLHQMMKLNRHKKFIPVPIDNSSFKLNECNYMKLITVEKIYESLINERYEIMIDEEIINKASQSVMKMIEISKKLGL
ncbi:MAG TPA: quinolinate synthase NadA [Bacteroidales bacterium]|nr:quinolinate synthase NadA [Bacteroidales bacterium]HQG53001.1 quinolinate synthase NadA [Bacteroidales bacterium]HQJ20623.1 quinolinate synthase NadA [Bacteroidales bacterium]